MYKIEKTNYGYKLEFEGFIQVDEMVKWLEESKKHLENTTGSFQLLVDMRKLKPLPEDAQAKMEEGQKLYKEKGMERSCVILDNVVTRMQFMRIAKETGIYAFERYIDASNSEDWEKEAMDWLLSEKDPDKK